MALMPQDDEWSAHARVAELRLIRTQIEDPDPAATAAQHSKGKLTARERVDLLVDDESFVEIEGMRRHRAQGFGLEDRRPYTDGVITGWGTVEGRRVFVVAQDFRIFGGALGEAYAEKIQKVLDLAESVGAPVVHLNDGAGARIQEGVAALAGYGGIFRRTSRLSGVVPQISVILGPCAGGSAYTPALTDFVFMVRGISHLFLTGPDVVRTVTGEDVTQESLGGADLHGAHSGVAHFVHDDEASCLAEVRYLLTLLPLNNRELPPTVASGDPADRSCPDLIDLVPVDGRQPYDVRMVIEELCDDGDHLEVHAMWARNIVCAFGRIDGELVGFVANQPDWLAGVLDIEASEKAASFVQLCDAFHIPIVTLVDVPGFLPGSEQERRGIIRHGAKLLNAYCTATVPRISVVLRKAYGGAYIVMNSPGIGSDLTLAWPTNEIAVMGAEAAANIVFRKSIAAADEPDTRRTQLIHQYQSELMHPYYAAERGLVDTVIDPADTRAVLAASLDMLRGKQVDLPYRKHGNVPL